MNEYVSYQREAVPEVLDLSHLQQESPKPRGLWFAPVEACEWGDDDDLKSSWQRWCEGELWAPCVYTHKYQMGPLVTFGLDQMSRLENRDRVLLISNMEDLKQFQAYFCSGDSFRLDWKSVAKLCAGIIIAPYQREARFTMDWYYPWDCSSGCIWRKPEGLTWEEMPNDFTGIFEPREW